MILQERRCGQRGEGADEEKNCGRMEEEFGEEANMKEVSREMEKKEKRMKGESYHEGRKQKSRKQREQLCSGEAAGWRSAPQRGRSKTQTSRLSFPRRTI